MAEIYYPVGVSVLEVRLEDALAALPPQALGALAGAAGGAHWIPDGAGWQMTAEGSSTFAKAVRGTVLIQAIPERMVITRNSYRQADTAEVGVLWEHLPIDPRIARSVGAAMYLGTVPADAWGKAMGKPLSTDPALAGTRYSVGSLLDPASTLRFAGFADTFRASHGSGGDGVSMALRDWTGILLDTPVPSEAYKQVDWDAPIVQLIVEILGTFKGFDEVWIHSIGVPEDARVQRSSVHTMGGKQKAGRAPKAKAETYWDLLTDLTVGAGLILFADVWQGPAPRAQDGSMLPAPACRFVLATPTVLYDPDAPRVYVETLATRQGDKLVPQQGRVGFEPSFTDRKRQHPVTGEASPWPVLVWGRNLEELSIERRLGRLKTPTIELVCLHGKRVLRGRSHDDPRADQVHPSGLWAGDTARQMVVSGFSDETALRRAARQVFEEIARGEFTVTFSTQDLASFTRDGTGNADPDLLELRAGNPIEILHATDLRGSAIGTRQAFEALGGDALRSWLIANGMAEDAAKSLAAAMDDPVVRDVLTRTFYVQQATHTWDRSEGYSCSVSATTYAQFDRNLGGNKGA